MTGGPFECELCYHIVQISGRQSWVRHVFSDLMPYICIFPGCKTPDRLYERRHHWMEHLKSHHPASFDPPSNAHTFCLLCQKKVTRGSIFDRHVGRHLENLPLFALPRSLFEDWNGRTLENEEEESAFSSLDGDDVEVEGDENNLASDANQDIVHIVQDENKADPSPRYEAARTGRNSWRRCCQCNNLINSLLAPDHCSICSHSMCVTCEDIVV